MNKLRAIRHEVHAWLIIVGSVVVLYVSSNAFITEAQSRNISPLEWLYYPLGVMFLLAGGQAVRIVKALRGIPDGYQPQSTADSHITGPAGGGVE